MKKYLTSLEDSGRTGSLLRQLFAGAALCLLGGCLSRPALDRQTYAFGVLPMTAAPALKSARILAVRPIRVAAPFDTRSLVYRTGEFSYQPDPYAEFLVAPGEDLFSTICICFRESGAFATVLEPNTARKPNTIAEITVDQLYGDFSDPGTNAAVLAISIVFLDAPNGIAERTILKRVYFRHMPLNEASARALFKGWSLGLAQILTEATADLERADFPPGQVPSS